MIFFFMFFFYDFFNDFFMIFLVVPVLAPKLQKNRGSPKTSRLLTPVGEGQVPACRHLLQTAAKVLKPYQAHLQCPTGFEPKAQISQIWAAISKFAFSINLHQCSSGPCKFPHCRLQDFFFKATEKKHQKTRLTKKGGGAGRVFFFLKFVILNLDTLLYFSLRLRRKVIVSEHYHFFLCGFAAEEHTKV